VERSGWYGENRSGERIERRREIGIGVTSRDDGGPVCSGHLGGFVTEWSRFSGRCVRRPIYGSPVGVRVEAMMSVVPTMKVVSDASPV
jgi:hypothetical protein